MYTGTRELSRRLRSAYVDVTLNSSRPGRSRVNECTTVCFFFLSRQYHVAHLGVPPDWQLRLEPALSPGSPNGSLEKSATNDATPPSGPTACRRITIVRCTIACSCSILLYRSSDYFFGQRKKWGRRATYASSVRPDDVRSWSPTRSDDSQRRALGLSCSIPRTEVTPRSFSAPNRLQERTFPFVVVAAIVERAGMVILEGSGP